MKLWSALSLITLLAAGCSTPKSSPSTNTPPKGEQPVAEAVYNPIGKLDTGWLLAISSDGRQMAFYNKLRGRIRILSWNYEAPERGLTVVELPIKLTWNTPHQAQFSPDGNLIIFDEYGGTGPSKVYISDLEGIIGVLKGADDFADMAFSPDGKQVAAVTAGFVRWDVATRKALETPDPETRFTDPSFEYVPGSYGQMIWRIIGKEGGPKTLIVRGSFSNKELLTRKLTGEIGEPNQPVLLDGKKLRVITLPTMKGGVAGYKFSPSGKRIGYRTNDRKHLIVVDSITGEEISRIEGGVTQDWWFVTDRLVADNDEVFELENRELAFRIIGNLAPVGTEIVEKDESGEVRVQDRALIMIADGSCTCDPGETAKLISDEKLRNDPRAVFNKLRELFGKEKIGRSTALVPR